MTAINPLFGSHPGSRMQLRRLKQNASRPPLFNRRSNSTATPPPPPSAPMTETTTHPVEAQPLDQSTLRDRLRAISEDDKSYSQARIAREAGISSATFSQFLGGTYLGNNEKTARTLQAWLESYDARLRDGGLPEGPAWVDTPTSRKIISALSYAQLGGDIVGIYGGAGLGKTQSIKRYAQTHPNVFHVEMTPATSGVLGCLEEIAIAVGLRDYSRQAAFLHRAICGRLKNTHGLLVIDEAQHLGVLALDQIRSINDRCSVGMALVGNERVFSQMVGSNRAAYLDRVYSRIGKWVSLKKASHADADAIIAAWGVEDVRCRDRIREIAARPGALRVLTKVLRLAATYAQARNVAMCCDDIQAAWRELGGMD